MQKVNHYIPTDLEWSAQGLPCEPRTLHRMCANILKHGTITGIVQHTSHWQNPEDTIGGLLGSGSLALTVECNHIPSITYVIHLTGFRVTEIIENIITEPGA